MVSLRRQIGSIRDNFYFWLQFAAVMLLVGVWVFVIFLWILDVFF